MRTSVAGYAKDLGRWGWVVLTTVPLTIAGGFLNIAESTPVAEWVIPTWGWFVMAIGGLAVAPFLAYHHVRLDRDRLREGRPAIQVTLDPEPTEHRVRLKVGNIGASASFVAMGRIVEHESGTPWPIQWRNTTDETQQIHKGDARVLNIATLSTPLPELPNVIEFHTANQPERPSIASQTLAIDSMYRQGFSLTELGHDVLVINPLTLEVSITSDPSMETQPHRTLWHLIRGDNATLDLLAVANVA